MIGVAITTRNRRGLFNRCLAQWRRRMPDGSVLVVVDDASDDPVPDSEGVTVLRNSYRLGVAMSKNRCMAALMDAGCTDMFLADDDVFPLSDWWWRPYVDSPEPHLSYQGPRSRRLSKVILVDGPHYVVEFPRGFLLYVTRDVIQDVGGMDPCFGMWGGEHVEWQRRIHEAGWTTWPFADVSGSDQIWYAILSSSTVGGAERRRMLRANGLPWQKPLRRFVPYREGRYGQDYLPGPEVEHVAGYPLLQHVVDLAPTGVAVEFGVGSGESTGVISRMMPVIGFDSGLGLPEDWKSEFPKGSFAYGIPQVDNSTIVEGWFAETLPKFDFESLGYIGLVHFDADLYSSTKTALDHIGKYLRPGTFIVFDEFIGNEDHEQRAFREFADQSGLGWTVVGHSFESWAIRIG